MLTASFPGSVSWKVRNDSTSWSSVFNRQNKTTLQMPVIPKPTLHLQRIFKKQHPPKSLCSGERDYTGALSGKTKNSLPKHVSNLGLQEG